MYIRIKINQNEKTIKELFYDCNKVDNIDLIVEAFLKKNQEYKNHIVYKIDSKNYMISREEASALLSNIFPDIIFDAHDKSVENYFLTLLKNLEADKDKNKEPNVITHILTKKSLVIHVDNIYVNGTIKI